MSAYQRAGTDVLDSRGVRIACCTDETAAMLVCNALCAMEERSDETVFTRSSMRPGDTVSFIPWGVTPSDYIPHTHRRETDEFACSCGLRWGVDEDDPHGA